MKVPASSGAVCVFRELGMWVIRILNVYAAHFFLTMKFFHAELLDIYVAKFIHLFLYDISTLFTVVPNLFGTRDWFHGRQFFHAWGWGCGQGMVWI